MKKQGSSHFLFLHYCKKKKKNAMSKKILTSQFFHKAFFPNPLFSAYLPIHMLRIPLCVIPNISKWVIIHFAMLCVMSCITPSNPCVCPDFTQRSHSIPSRPMHQEGKGNGGREALNFLSVHVCWVARTMSQPELLFHLWKSRLKEI